MMLLRTIFCVLTILLIALAPTNAAPTATDPKIPFVRYQLDNGLEVILHQDKTLPLVAVNLWYHVGSGDETPQKSGFAHLFEHMMFQGSRHVGEDAHFSTLEKIGGTSINGTTNSDRTNYFEIVPAHQLETALWLESDRMGYMLPLLSQKSLDNQREVVRNERRQRYDNVPYGKADFVLHELLFDGTHPYRYMTIGRHEDLVNASLEDVHTFFRTWYVPANATLVLAGDFEISEAKTLISKWFGTFPKAEQPSHHFVAPSPVASTKRQVVTDPFAKLRRIHYAWHTPKAFASGDAELDLLASVLADEGTGRLYKILVHDRQWVQSVVAYQSGAQFSSVFHLIVDVKEDADLAQIEQVLEVELEKVRREPVGESEHKRALAKLESGFVWGLESLMERADVLQHYNHYLGTPDYVFQDLARYRNATPQTILETARQYLSKPQRVEVLTMPQPAPEK